MDKIKYIILCILAAMMLPGCSDSHSGSDAKEDSKLAFDIQQMTITDPERALDMLDSAEQRGTIKPFLIDYLRCLAYHNGLSDYKTAIRYALKAYKNPDTPSMPDIHHSLIDMIANEYMENGNYEMSMKYCNEGINLAIKDKDKLTEANLNVTLATNLEALKRKDEAMSRLNTAMDILEKEAKRTPNESGVWDDYIYSLGMAIHFMTDNEKWDDALAMQSRCDEAIKGLEGSDDVMDGLVDMRKASAYSEFAYAYAAKGDIKTAESIYDKFKATKYAGTHDGALMIIPYLVEAHRYKEAQDFLKSEKEYWKVTADTISESYITMCLDNEIKIYEEQNDYKAANMVRKSIIEISDIIHEQESKTSALELAEEYKTTEQALLILQNKASIQKRNIVIWAITVILIFAAIMMVKIIRYNTTVRNKNRTLRKNIDEMMDYKDALVARQQELVNLNEELERLKRSEPDTQKESMDSSEDSKGQDNEDTMSETIGDTDSRPETRRRESDRILFDKINYEVITKQLYLKHDFSRNFLLERYNIPVNRFAMIFKTFAGCSFNQYVQQCRLDYAVRLMRDNPNWSLDAIAKDSNMSKTAFYEQFQNKYGMSPSEFRNNYNNK